MFGTQDAVEYLNMLCGQQQVEKFSITATQKYKFYNINISFTFRLNPERPASDLKEAYNMTVVDDQHVSLANLSDVYLTFHYIRIPFSSSFVNSIQTKEIKSN